MKVLEVVKVVYAGVSECCKVVEAATGVDA
jgi:hypothetical protein